MKSLPTTCALALTILFGVFFTGCQSSIRMTRPDTSASLSRPESWIRERDVEHHDTVFQLRHPVEAVRVRLRRLSSPVITGAHKLWLLMWAEESFDSFEAVELDEGRVGHYPALVGQLQAVDDTVPIEVDVRITNAGGATYLLESWGTPYAMAKSAEARKRIRQSVRLPAEAESTPPADSAQVVTGSGWQLELPSPPASEVAEHWVVDPTGNDGRQVLKLPSRLIEAEIVYEALDYPIDATQYARVALERAHGGEAPSENPPSGKHDVRIRLPAAQESRVPMLTTYRFMTRGERALQMVVSTPELLYAKNQQVIEALLDSLSFEPNPGDHAQPAE